MAETNAAEKRRLDFVADPKNAVSGHIYALVGATKNPDHAIRKDADGYLLPTRMENLYVFSAAWREADLAGALKAANLDRPLINWSHGVVGKLRVHGTEGAGRNLHFVATYSKEKNDGIAHGAFWWLEADAPLHSGPGEWLLQVGDQRVCVHGLIDLSTMGKFSDEWSA